MARLIGRIGFHLKRLASTAADYFELIWSSNTFPLVGSTSIRYEVAAAPVTVMNMPLGFIENAQQSWLIAGAISVSVQ